MLLVIELDPIRLTPNHCILTLGCKAMGLST